jgi:hypothetical protein
MFLAHERVTARNQIGEMAEKDRLDFIGKNSSPVVVSDGFAARDLAKTSESALVAYPSSCQVKVTTEILWMSSFADHSADLALHRPLRG